VFEDFLRKVWADKIAFQKLDIPERVITDDVDFSYSA
jgi:hypothetical protein